MFTILTGKISQSGTEAPTITLIENPCDLDIQIEYSKEGTYTATADKEVFNNDMPPIWYNSDSLGNKYVVSQLNRTQFEIAVYDLSGNNVDSRLSGNLFEVKI